MADMWFPTWLRVSSQNVTQVSNTASERSIFSGATTSITRSGDRQRYRLSIANASDRASVAEKAKMRSLIAALRGPANHIWYSPADYVQRGSFPSQELLSNNTFASGTTSWQAQTATASSSIAVVDREMLVTATSGSNGEYTQCGNTAAISLTAYAPYVARAFVRPIAPATHSVMGCYFAAGGVTGSKYSVDAGLKIGSAVANSASGGFALIDYCSGPAGFVAGFSFASVTRGMLIDNSPNLLTYSDQFDNAAWAKTNVTVTANSVAAPDNTTTADSLIATTTSGYHLINQSTTVSSAADDYCQTLCVKAGALSTIILNMVESGGSTQLTVTFNASTGVFSSSSVGSGWIDHRYYSVSLGNGWYRIYQIGRKTGSGTTVSARAFLSYTGTFAGDGTSALYVWRGGLAQSSVPFTPAQTTTTASTGTTQTGNTINVKGLPVNTNGLLLEGDLVQIGSQLCPVVASLNSDAAGCGTLQLAYPPRTAPADNDPIIVGTPMGYMCAVNNENGYSCAPGGLSDFELELEEALA